MIIAKIMNRMDAIPNTNPVIAFQSLRPFNFFGAIIPSIMAAIAAAIPT